MSALRVAGTHTDAHIHTCTQTHIHTDTCTNAHTDDHTCKHEHMHRYTHAQTQVHTHTHTRTHTCTRRCTRAHSQVHICRHRHTHVRTAQHYGAGLGSMTSPHAQMFGDRYGCSRPLTPGAELPCQTPAPLPESEGNSPEACLGSYRHRLLQRNTDRSVSPRGPAGVGSQGVWVELGEASARGRAPNLAAWWPSTPPAYPPSPCNNLTPCSSPKGPVCT